MGEGSPLKRHHASAFPLQWLGTCWSSRVHLRMVESLQPVYMKSSTTTLHHTLKSSTTERHSSSWLFHFMNVRSRSALYKWVGVPVRHITEFFRHFEKAWTCRPGSPLGEADFMGQHCAQKKGG